MIDRVLREINLRLVACNIEAQIRGREKNLYNIHQKMLSKKLKFEEVLDIYGFRVIVNSVPACYAALARCTACISRAPEKSKTTSPSPIQRLQIAAHHAQRTVRLAD